MEITVTISTRQAALVRLKQPGQIAEYRELPLSGPPGEAMESVLAFIWAHLPQDAYCPREGWPWEA